MGHLGGLRQEFLDLGRADVCAPSRNAFEYNPIRSQRRYVREPGRDGAVGQGGDLRLDEGKRGLKPAAEPFGPISHFPIARVCGVCGTVQAGVDANFAGLLFQFVRELEGPE